MKSTLSIIAMLLITIVIPNSHCMNGIIASYTCPNVDVLQFQSLQQTTEGICGGCAIVNAVAIADIMRDAGPAYLTPANVQCQAEQYPETTEAVYFYDLATNTSGLNLVQILNYAHAHGLNNVFIMDNDLKIYDLNGCVNPDRLKDQIAHQPSYIGFFICRVLVENSGHAVLNVLIKEPGKQSRIIFMDSNNTPLLDNRLAQAQTIFLTCFV